MNPNMLLHEQAKMVTGLAPFTPSTTTPDFVSLKNCARLTIVIIGDNATTVTGSAITLLQSTVVAGTDEKALAFTKMYGNIDTATSDLQVETAVTANTFTTTAIDAKNSLYIIEVEASSLDVANGFDCVRLGTADATATVLSVLYILWPMRYGSKVIDSPSAVVD